MSEVQNENGGINVQPALGPVHPILPPDQVVNIVDASDAAGFKALVALGPITRNPEDPSNAAAARALPVHGTSYVYAATTLDLDTNKLRPVALADLQCAMALPEDDPAAGVYIVVFGLVRIIAGKCKAMYYRLGAIEPGEHATRWWLTVRRF